MLAPAIAAGVAGVASFIGGERANRANVRLSRENREWQERMSNTAYQRAVEDMRLAGINPALAYMQGGASSPGGSVATVDDAVGPAVSSAMHGSRLSQELKIMRQQHENMMDEGQRIRDSAMESRMRSTLLSKQTRLLDLDEQAKARMLAAGGPEASVRLTEAQIRAALASGRLSELQIPGMENVARIEGHAGGQAGAIAKYLLNMIRRR